MILRQNILATLGYYDVLDVPLKKDEILARMISFKHLNSEESRVMPFLMWPSLKIDVERELDQLIIDGVVDRVGDCYFLFGREYLVPLRFKNEKIAIHKWRKTLFAVKWLRIVPYVEIVFASGSLAINNTTELSDLDVLIIVKKGRIWLTRLLIIVLLSVLRVRRRGSDKIAPDKICLNHYISDESLQIPFKSIYNAQTYSNLVTIYARENEMVEKFKEANGWVTDFVLNWNMFSSPILKGGIAGGLARITEAFLNNKVGDFFEKIARKLQYERIRNNPATNESGGRIVFNDEQLEFHPHSIETSIIRKYNDNLIKLDLADLAVERDSGLTSSD